VREPLTNASGEALSALKRAMEEQRYGPFVIEQYVREARRFLEYLDRQGLALQTASEREVAGHVGEQLARYRGQHGRDPASLTHWRCRHTGAVRMLLRLTHGGGREGTLRSDGGIDPIIQRYSTWLRDVRGAAPLTIAVALRTAAEFLAWTRARFAVEQGPWPLAPGDVDAFLQWRTSHVARATRKWVAYHLRSFLRHLYREGLMGRDLAPAVSGGRVYQGERAPVPLTEEEITRVVSQAKRERAHQPAGRRDYATLSLLATYGMRASEIVHLRLEDIDWRHERIRIRHAKRGAVSDVPLLPAVGEAVLDYLRHGRPTTSRREVFVRSRAPYETPLRADALYQAVARWLARAGVHACGPHGPHAFRHGRAIGLLRAGVSLKTIGDILGHRRASSTQVYLQLHTSDLREVALSLPGIHG